ncbi:SRPBCC family protein [Brevundimonas sp.]|uniref:SRPBCC family protein n=1 Tax=Brevundimonas sp. TaxID=1871086 RepID=UPI003D0BE50C
MAEPIEIRVEKRFRHPRERVFDAFVDPAHVGLWLFHTPDGVMEQVEYDPVPGGGFTIVERRGETLARHLGRFVEIMRPERIGFDFRTDDDGEWTRVTVVFEAGSDGCRIVLTHDLAAEWAAYERQTVHGWTTILAALETVLHAGAGS